MVLFQPDYANNQYTCQTYTRISRHGLIRAVCDNFVIRVTSMPDGIVYASDGHQVFTMDNVPLADGAMLAVVPPSPPGLKCMRFDEDELLERYTEDQV